MNDTDELWSLPRRVAGIMCCSQTMCFAIVNIACGTAAARERAQAPQACSCLGVDSQQLFTRSLARCLVDATCVAVVPRSQSY